MRNFHFIIILLHTGDASSPHGATCIQYNGSDGNSPSSKPSSPSSPAGAGNEGLTRQQLDLISQIMQQTKQANASITVASSGSNSTATTTLVVGGGGQTTGAKQAVQRPRTWNMQVSAFIIFEYYNLEFSRDSWAKIDKALLI